MSPDLSTTFAALADPSRRARIARLASGETTVAGLAEPLEMSGPAISKHLKVLERAGLISRPATCARGSKTKFGRGRTEGTGDEHRRIIQTRLGRMHDAMAAVPLIRKGVWDGQSRCGDSNYKRPSCRELR